MRKQNLKTDKRKRCKEVSGVQGEPGRLGKKDQAA